jgi:hypothetical protein
MHDILKCGWYKLALLWTLCETSCIAAAPSSLKREYPYPFMPFSIGASHSRRNSTAAALPTFRPVGQLRGAPAASPVGECGLPIGPPCAAARDLLVWVLTCRSRWLVLLSATQSMETSQSMEILLLCWSTKMLSLLEMLDYFLARDELG